jgi:hypothetical protein
LRESRSETAIGRDAIGAPLSRRPSVSEEESAWYDSYTFCFGFIRIVIDLCTVRHEENTLKNLSGGASTV